jgi:capsular exopolysaccharide synthesis family protein
LAPKAAESYVYGGQGPGRYDPPATGEEPEVGLLEYWRILRRRKGTVIAIACAGLLAGFLVTLPQTPLYQARASLEIQDLNQDFMNMKQVSPIADSPSYTALSDIQTQIKILQSDTLAERTVAKLRPTLAQARELPPSRLDMFRRMFKLPVPSALERQDAGLKAMPKSMKVRAAGQTRIIEVLVDSPDPKLAAEFANTISNEFIQQNMEARWEMSQRTGDWLSRQLDDMRVKLERSDDALQSYARQTGLMFTGDNGNGTSSGGSVSEQKLRQLQEELSKAQADRMTQQSRYELTKNAMPETLPDVLNDSNLREFQSKLADLERQKAELTSTFKPEYSKVKRVEAQLKTIQVALDRSRNDILGRIKNDFDAATRRERLLAAAYATQVELVTRDSQKAIQYNILKREVDSNRQLYEAMLQRVKESSIASAMKASNVRIVDEAKPPKKPYSPSLPLNAGLGLLAGGFLGIAFVVMRERADKTLQQPGEVALFLQAPELGVIPSANAARNRLYYYSPKKRIGKEDGTAPLPPAKEDRKRKSSVDLITLSERPSMTAEAFRVVLTSILFSNENGSRPRVLVVTSPGPGEGKTTVATNLAISMAEIGRKVLLVDADLRRPRVHTLFNLPNEAGLTSLLQSRSLEKADVDAVIQPTQVASLFVMPSGPATSAAANLLFSPVMHLLLQRFKTEYDMVILDTPPSLQMPDARVVGREADAVVLVIRAGRTTRDAALATSQRFSEDKTRILGTILNDWNPSTSPNGYYGYYKGYYTGSYKS